MASQQNNTFGARAALKTASGSVEMYRLDALARQQATPLDRLPFTVRVLVENALRQHDLEPGLVSEADVLALARWEPGKQPGSGGPAELPFMPARACSCRTSPACQRWWTLRPCATR
jgi:aconitate hydratase